MKNSTDLKKLCLDLANANSENDVISILKSVDLWEDNSNWNYYGNNENNFSTIGNQQSTAEAAMVEKIINCVDAVLMKECLVKEITPDSKEAPQSLEDALYKFFGIFKGKLTNYDLRLRGELAKKILLVATGGHKNPSYSIIDTGEGQSPNRMPLTFLSLSKSNKLRIPFVQGKFNMGATGSLQFCGHNNIQLIISKRDPDISKKETDDDSVNDWGFTIIKREDPQNGLRSSAFKYLAPNGKILRFKSESLPLIPTEYPNPFGNPLKSGSYVKLYEYQLKPALKTNIKFDLYYKLSLLLPSIALPITLYERRKGYRADSYHSVMSGLNVRLDEDKRDNLEPGFPNSSEIQIQNEKIKVSIYVFKKDQSEKYTNGEGVIFSINGQTHGTLPTTFFERKSVGMSYLSDSILIMADCSGFSGRTREDLFMNSRDRLRDGEIKDEIVNQLEEIIKNHEGLRALREKRRREELDNLLQDSKPLVDVLNKIIKKSPSLTKLFVQGLTLQNPFNLVGAGSQAIYNGKQFPTYFNLKRKNTLENPKGCHINMRFRIQFETDVENQYFERDNDPGEFELTLDNKKIESYSLNLWNGIATLNVELPEEAKIGDILKFTSTIRDINQIDPYIIDFFVIVTDPESIIPRPDTPRIPPSSENPGSERLKPSSLNLPNINECWKSQGDKYKFREDEYGALIVKDSGENGYDFYVNMDNIYLKTEMKGLVKSDPRLLQSQFKYGMVLIGISCIRDFEKKPNCTNDGTESIFDKIYFFSKAISPVLLPMISGLGEMQIEE